MLGSLARNLMNSVQPNRLAKHVTNNVLAISKRHQTSTYEGDGKTKVHILNQDLELGLMINTYSQFGFRLNNGLQVVGPMAIFPRSVLSWSISNYEDINEDALTLFYLIEPKIDILVLGIGDATMSRDIQEKILSFMRKYRINVEILQTEQACAIFNFLNAEQRLVAGAIIPPTSLKINENDLMAAQRRHDSLYSREEFF